MVLWRRLAGTSAMVGSAQTKRPDLINRSLLMPVELGSGDIELVGAESKYNRESVFSCCFSAAPSWCTAVMPLARCYHLQTSRLPEATPLLPCPTLLLLACAHCRQVVGRPHPRCH
jgi:hypothetical protein